MKIRDSAVKMTNVSRAVALANTFLVQQCLVFHRLLISEETDQGTSSITSGSPRPFIQTALWRALAEAAEPVERQERSVVTNNDSVFV